MEIVFGPRDRPQEAAGAVLGQARAGRHRAPAGKVAGGENNDLGAGAPAPWGRSRGSKRNSTVFSGFLFCRDWFAEAPWPWLTFSAGGACADAENDVTRSGACGARALERLFVLFRPSRQITK